MKMDLTPSYVAQWISLALQPQPTTLLNASSLRIGPGREVRTCSITIGPEVRTVILKIFKPGAPHTVNTNLPPLQAAEKCALALQELPHFGIPTAQYQGMAVMGDMAAVVMGKVKPATWNAQIRIAAATCLARLHTIPLHYLSPSLLALVQKSDPRPQRIISSLIWHIQELDKAYPAWRSAHTGIAAEAQALITTGTPQMKPDALVHGDYFSKNILPMPNGLCIIDWETLALGDPMWDLAFLIGADRDIAQQEVEAVIEAYRTVAPLERSVLLWHKHCWDISWQLRDILKARSRNA